MIDAISEPNPENLNKEKKIRIIDAEIDTSEGCKFRSRCPYVVDKCKIEPNLEIIKDDHAVACYVKLD